MLKVSNLAKKMQLHRTRDVLEASRRLLIMVWDMDKRLFMGAAVAVLIPSIIPFINAYIYKLIIDAVIAGAASDVFDTDTIVPLLIARLVTYFAQDAAFNTQTFMERLLWTKFPIYLRERLLLKIASLDIEKFEDPAFRDTLERARESDYRPQNLITSMLFAAQSLVQFLIAFAALLYLNWIFIFLVAAIAVPEFMYRLYEDKTSWSIWAWHSPRKKRYSYLSDLLQEAKGIKELRTFHLAPTFVREMTDVQQEYYDDNKKLAIKSYGFQMLFNALSTFVFVGIEAYIIFLTFMKRVTVGDISFYTQVISNFQNGLGGLLRNINSMFEASLYVQSIFEVLDTPSAITAPPHAKKLVLTEPPSIAFEDVSFRYAGTDHDILHHFSLTIQSGEKIAFVGENGAGKTTIIKLLARFYDPTGGRITVNGIDLKDIDPTEWQTYLAILFQDFNRYEDSAKKNIYYGNIRRTLDMKDIEQAATDAGAKAIIETLKEGYEQILGRMFESGEDLSVGQWQKMALARAYFRNAPVLILDEPTAAIDAKAEAEIFERVEELSRNKTVILISHRFSTVRMADRIIVMNEGAVLEEGSHEVLMTKKGLYAELFSLQAKGYS